MNFVPALAYLLLLPCFACSIHATRGTPFIRSLYIWNMIPKSFLSILLTYIFAPAFPLIQSEKSIFDTVTKHTQSCASALVRGLWVHNRFWHTLYYEYVQKVWSQITFHIYTHCSPKKRIWNTPVLQISRDINFWLSFAMYPVYSYWKHIWKYPIAVPILNSHCNVYHVYSFLGAIHLLRSHRAHHTILQISARIIEYGFQQKEMQLH